MTAVHNYDPVSTLTRCTSISIHDDDTVEAAEFFEIVLTCDDSSVTLPGSNGLVAITNDDCKRGRYLYIAHRYSS